MDKSLINSQIEFTQMAIDKFDIEIKELKKKKQNAIGLISMYKTQLEQLTNNPPKTFEIININGEPSGNTVTLKSRKKYNWQKELIELLSEEVDFISKDKIVEIYAAKNPIVFEDIDRRKLNKNIRDCLLRMHKSEIVSMVEKLNQKFYCLKRD